MSQLSKLDAHHTLYAAIAVLLGLALALTLWVLGQAEQMALLTAGPGQKLSPLQDIYARTAHITWLAGAALLAVAAAAARWLSAELGRPLREATALARQVAQGDLSGQVSVQGGGAGELLGAMQDMNDRLAGMIVKVRSGTESIAASAGQVAAGSMALSVRTEEQAASLTSTAAAMDQFTATVRQGAEHAHQASRLAMSASDVAARGGAVVAEVAGTMAAITASSSRVAGIIDVIDALAFQTSILAVNAAVEAARAGEQGRPLALVAGEARSLAQRSQAAARDLRLLMDDTANKVSAGAELAGRAGNVMLDIVDSVIRVAEATGGMARASAEQTAAIGPIAQAISAMDGATRQHGALVKQSAAAAALLRDEAGMLSRVSAAFVLGPKHGERKPAVHLVASNPHLRPRPAAGAQRAPEMHVVASSPAARAARTRGAMARLDLDWEEF